MAESVKGVTEKEGVRIARRAVREARRYFRIPAEWNVRLAQSDPGDTKGQITAHPAYLDALIEYDLTQAESNADLYSTLGHEVAHLFLAEYDELIVALLQQLEKSGEKTQALEALTDGVRERATTRLERMFCRDVPYQAKAD